jgi:2-polyprenyl-3-methyl-5-hydroxy-6-metoxy-1,4-benzoquinol methylase
LIDQFDPATEGFKDYKQQRDYSVRFAWGHNHNFGTFALNGEMGNRHVEIIADFMDNFGLPHDLSGKKILDVGVWTGGTSLILSALGAQVTALEEVVKYSNTVNYLASAFGLSGLECKPISLYELAVNDIYDYVIYAGVIYHVTDPILSLRILFNSLKDSGRIFIETFGISGNDINKKMLVRFEGPRGVKKRSKEDLNRTGWNCFIPSPPALLLWVDAAGFSDVTASKIDSSHRIKCVGTRHKHEDMLRAGLSRPDIR